MTPSYEMTLYLSDVREKKSNTSYPYEAHITGIAELAKAAQFDHVSAKYADGTNSRGNAVKAHRSKKTFIEADNINMDCDNKEKSPGKVANAKIGAGGFSQRRFLCRAKPQPHEGEKRPSSPSQVPLLFSSSRENHGREEMGGTQKECASLFPRL